MIQYDWIPTFDGEDAIPTYILKIPCLSDDAIRKIAGLDEYFENFRGEYIPTSGISLYACNDEGYPAYPFTYEEEKQLTENQVDALFDYFGDI